MRALKFLPPMLATLFAAILFVAGPVGPAGAQSASSGSGAKFGAWTLKCSAPNRCSLNQRIVTRKNRKLLADIALNLRTINGKRRVLMVINTPDGVALSTNPAFLVDKRKKTVALSWRTCSGGQCRAAAILTPKQQGAVMAGNIMRLGYKRFRAEKTTAFSVSLRGVTAGLAALAAR